MTGSEESHSQIPSHNRVIPLSFLSRSSRILISPVKNDRFYFFTVEIIDILLLSFRYFVAGIVQCVQIRDEQISKKLCKRKYPSSCTVKAKIVLKTTTRKSKKAFIVKCCIVGNFISN